MHNNDVAEEKRNVGSPAEYAIATSKEPRHDERQTNVHNIRQDKKRD